MLLFDLFVQLHPHASTQSPTNVTIEQLSSQMLTQEDLAFAYKKITAAYREAPAHREAYDAFLTHCHHALGAESQTAMLPLIIDYLAELKTSSCEEKYTHTHKILTLLNMHLHEQTHALGLVTLGRCFIDQPTAFSAFIQWLMQHDVSPNDILHAHLLQDYFRYHLYSLSTPNNPIEQLYALLNHQADTRALAITAMETRCPEEGLASYALDGSIHDLSTKKLKNPSLNLPKIEFIPTDRHIKALHRVFGVPFLMAVLQRAYEDKHQTLPTPVLIALFNGPHITHQNFSVLFQHLREHEHFKKILVKYLLNTTMDELLKAHISGVPGLILYSDYLTQKISCADNFSNYIHDIKQASTSDLDLIADLSALLNKFEKRNSSHALLVFNHLFEIILKHPEVLDDENLLRQLRKFKPAKAELIAHSAWLENSFHTCVQTHTNTLIEDFDYITVEDVWRAIQVKLRAIQTIESIPNTLPSDKYQLQCHLLKAFLPQLHNNFTLDDFIQHLGIAPSFDPREVTPYERLLIEALVSINDASLRSDIIHRLDTNIPKARPWYDLQFNQHSLYMHAAHHGNLPMVLWLKSHHVKQPESCEEITSEAANLGHWAIVGYYHQRAQFHQPFVNGLLELAIKQNAAEAIPTLWRGQKSPRLKMIETCFKRAVEAGHVDCVKALLACPRPPCDAVMTKGYKIAQKNQQTSIMHALAEAAATGHHPCLNKAIQQTKNLKKIPRLKGTKSCDPLPSPGYTAKQHEALKQHGLFRAKKTIDVSRSCDNLTLPPIVSRQTSV
ncbi:MAG: hypothetical protein GW760_03440 [Legionella sp.]|jgi:hypothetical protein|nr:hypothetical protein [Legionella sp.]